MYPVLGTAVLRAFIITTLVLQSVYADGAAKERPAGSRNAASPQVKKTVLSCGVPLLVREDHRLPFVYFCAAFRGGLLSEDESNSGITRLMSNLLTRGTKTRSGEQIAVIVESLGGKISPFSGRNSFGLQAKCLTTDVETFMEILADCLLNAAFPDDEIVKQKTVQIAEIDQQHERPFFLARKALRGILFQDHPYGQHPLGRKETVRKIERDDLLAHFRKLAVSGNLVISIFGDITPADAGTLAEDLFRGIRKAPAPVWTHEKAKPPLPARTKQRVPKEQAVLLVGFPGVDIKDPRNDALDLLQRAMSGLSSDLSTAVREERGLAYYVGAYHLVGIEPGAFVVYAGTREDAAGEVEQLIRKEIGRIIAGGIRKEELERARNRIIAAFEMGLQDNLSVAMTCALNELYGLGHAYSFTTRQRFEALTLEDVHRAAESVLSTNKFITSLILPRKRTQ